MNPQRDNWRLSRRTLCSLGLSVPLAAVLPSPAGAVSGPGLPPDPFFAYDRPARYEVVREDVKVPLRDGSHLAGQLYRPGTAAGRPAVGTFPGIVYEYTAYADSA